MYRPAILSAIPKKYFAVGHYRAVFLQDIVSDGLIQYEYIIEVSKQDDFFPCLYITSERRDSGDENDGGNDLNDLDSHFLCLFQNDKHLNYSSSNDWADADKFEQEAITILTEMLKNDASQK